MTRQPAGRRVVMEGGAIDVNGRGTLLATEECLLSETQARNPGLDRVGLEQIFADYPRRQPRRLARKRHRRATTRMATSTTLRDSWGRAPSSPSSNHEPTIQTTSRSRTICAGCKPRADQDGAAPPRRRAADAPARRFRRPATSGQLRQFLHRQRNRSRSDVQRSCRPHRPQHTRRVIPRAPGHRHSQRRPRPRARHLALPITAAAGRPSL